MTRTRISASALLLVSAITLAGCSPATTGSGDASEVDPLTTEPIRVGTQKPTSLVPGNSSGAFALTVAETVFSGLVTYDPATGEPVNLVAETIETDDQRVWEITLEDGWTFHNGEPVDAESFARAWNTAVNPANAWVGSAQLSGIAGYDAVNPAEGEPTADQLSGVEVTGELALTVTLDQPDSQFLYALGQPAWFPLPEAALEDLEAYALQPVGNGPYELAEPWTGGQEIITERYADYGGEPASNSGVIFTIYSGYDVAYRDFQAGELDITGVLSADLAGAESELGDRLLQLSGSNFTYLGLPVWEEQYTDPRIRQALSLAIDRQTIIDALLDGSTEPLTDFDAPTSVGYRDDAGDDVLTYDPERAKQLWDEAGGVEGTLTLTVVEGTGRDAWSEAIINSWRDVLGVDDVALTYLPSENTISALLAQEVPNPAGLNTPVAYPSPSFLLNRAYRTGGTSNYSHYANAEVDALLDAAAAAATDEEATQLYDDAKDILLAELPAIPLWSPGSSTAVSERVADGYTPSPFVRSGYAAIAPTS